MIRFGEAGRSPRTRKRQDVPFEGPQVSRRRVHQVQNTAELEEQLRTKAVNAMQNENQAVSGFNEYFSIGEASITGYENVICNYVSFLLPCPKLTPSFPP